MDEAEQITVFAQTVLPFAPDGWVQIWRKDGASDRGMWRDTSHHNMHSLVARVLELNKSAGAPRCTYVSMARMASERRRLAEQALALRALWLDCDIKPDGFASFEAIAAALRSLTGAGWPVPSLLMRSGGGVQVFWGLRDELSVEEWRPLADGLKRMCQALNLACDHNVTADAARVMRMPATWNTKYSPPRRTELLTGTTTPPLYGPQDFLHHISKLQPAPVALKPLSQLAPYAAKVEPDPDYMTSPAREPVSAPALFKACRLFAQALTAGVWPGSGWYMPARNLAAALGERGRAIYHRMSHNWEDLATGKKYSVADTDAKYDAALRLVATDPDRAPISCYALSEDKPDACAGCAYADRRAPDSSFNNLMAARDYAREEAARELARPVPVAEGWVSHALPLGYYVDPQTKTTKIDKQGEKTTRQVTVLNGVIVGAELRSTPSVNAAGMPSSSSVLHCDIMTGDQIVRGLGLPLAELSGIKLWNELARVGAPIETKDRAETEKFIMAFVRQLQAARSAGTAAREGTYALGWTETGGFTYDGVVYEEGSAPRVGLHLPPDQRGLIGSAGTLETWCAGVQPFLEFRDPALWSLFLAGFGGPLVPLLTGPVRGATLCVYGEGGSGKSTAAAWGASIYGDPKALILSGDWSPAGATRRAATLRHIPCYVDDIGKRRGKSAQQGMADGLGNMIKSVSEGQIGLKLRRDGTERGNAHFSGILPIALNQPLSELISISAMDELTATIMDRVVDLRTHTSGKYAGTPDTALYGSNYGVAGRPYIRHVAENRSRYAHMINHTRDVLLAANGNNTQDRFIASLFAALIVGGLAAKASVLPSLDMEWYTRQVPQLWRGAMSVRAMLAPMRNNQLGAEAILSELIALATKDNTFAVIMSTALSPQGNPGTCHMPAIYSQVRSLTIEHRVFGTGQHSIVVISLDGLRRMAPALGMGATEVVEVLKRNFGATQTKRRLGAGTAIGAGLGRRDVLVIDCAHPAMAWYKATLQDVAQDGATADQV